MLCDEWDDHLLIRLLVDDTYRRVIVVVSPKIGSIGTFLHTQQQVNDLDELRDFLVPTSASCRLRNDCVICVNPAITHKGITA